MNMKKNKEISIQLQSRKWILLMGTIIGVTIGIIAFLPIWIKNNGQYMEYGDYFLQYVPFIKELKRMFLSGDFSWSWNSFLGDGFIGAYSYYTVFNPFAWLVSIFPDEYILYGTLFATMLKFAISMISSMLYMRCFCKKDSYAMIGALIYTFSGFTIVNTNFYFFLDVIAVFPLVMYGLERLIREKKCSLYIWSLMLNAVINYYFFVSTVIIVIIYVVIRLELYKFSSWKTQWKNFSYIAVYSIIGTGLASIALIPSFFAILGSGKATESIGAGIELFYYPQKLLENLRTLVAPIESGRYHVFYDSSIWSSTGIYLPIFGSVFVLDWCLKKKDWLKKICIILGICYFVPVLNATFNLFSSVVYTRWLYGMALIFALVTVLKLEELEQCEKSISKKLLVSITIFTMGLLLVPTIIYVLHDYYGISLLNRFASVCITEYFMGYKALVIMLILTAINYVALWFIYIKRCSGTNLIYIVMFGCALNFFVYNMINYDVHPTDYANDYYYKKALIEGKKENNKDFLYRIDYPKEIANYSLFKNRPSVNYYNSLQNSCSSRFAQAVGIGEGIDDTILVTPLNGGNYTDSLLSVKYYYDYDGNGNIPEGFQYLKTEAGVKIYKNNNYIPMGFTYNSYCLEEELKKLSPEEKAKMMLEVLVIQKEDEKIVSKSLSKISNFNMDSINVEKAISDRNKVVCNRFEGTSKGFSAEINLNDKNIVFFSIPNDKGWEITVNNKPANVIEVNYGLLGVICDKGANKIIATYHTRGWNLGIGCSIFFIMMWLGVEIIERRKQFKEAY